MDKDEPVRSAANELGLLLKETDAGKRFEELADKVNALLVGDFDRLITILYRMDVSDIKLKQLLKKNPGEDAGKIIAQLMVERQAQKLQSRQQFRPQDEEIDENDKW